MDAPYETIEEPLTIEQIVEAGLRLTPKAAAHYTNGNIPRLCSTPIFTRARMPGGEVVELRLLPRSTRSQTIQTYGAGYVRVSTEKQRSHFSGGDGFSLDDQLYRTASHFIHQRLAFRIFSDAELSGGLPINDPALIERMWARKADLYAKVFRAVFLSEYTKRRTPDEVRQLENYLAEAVDKIKHGIAADSAAIDDLDRGIEVEEESPPAKRPGRPAKRSVLSYRPGLTTIVRNLSGIHTLAVTDLSRLSRSQLLFAEIAEALRSHNIRVVGLIESLEWLNDDGISSEIAALILPKIAEYKLREVSINAMRGILTMLDSGRPHGILPSWLKRDKDGNVQINQDRVEPIRRIVEIYLSGETEDDQNGFHAIACQLTREDFAPPSADPEWRKFKKPRDSWYWATIRSILRNPALVGRQRMFGLEWQVYPPLVSEEEWIRIQQRRADRAGRHAPPTNKTKNYMAAGLFRCSCGMIMHHHISNMHIHQYVCSEATVPRAKKTRKHVTLNLKDTEAFLNDLMESHPAAISDAFKNSSKGLELQREVARLRAEAEEFKQHLPLLEARRLEEAREKARQIGLEKPETVQAIFRNLMEDDLAMEARIENLLKERQYRLSTLVPEDHIHLIEERIAAWRGMDDKAKNDLLRTLFDGFEVCGEPPNEYIRVKLRTPDDNELPPIQLRTTVRQRCLIRRFPAVREWFASWHLRVHRKEAEGA